MGAFIPPINQESRPLIFALFNSAPSSLALAAPIITVFGQDVVKPEHIAYSRPARGTVTSTIGGAFLDDYGEGVGSISIEGHTGWRRGGLTQFKLIELTFQEYLRRRAIASDGGGDPNSISLWLIDTLNLEASSVYPLEFVGSKTRTRPLLFNYRMRFTILTDLLAQAESFIPNFFGAPSGLPGIVGSLLSITNGFVNVISNLPG